VLDAEHRFLVVFPDAEQTDREPVEDVIAAAFGDATRHHAHEVRHSIVTRPDDDDSGHLEVTVPDGTEAQVQLPDGSATVVGPGTHHSRWSISKTAS
jgi:hypothetical protein